AAVRVLVALLQAHGAGGARGRVVVVVGAPGDGRAHRHACRLVLARVGDAVEVRAVPGRLRRSADQMALERAVRVQRARRADVRLAAGDGAEEAEERDAGCELEAIHGASVASMGKRRRGPYRREARRRKPGRLTSRRAVPTLRARIRSGSASLPGALFGDVVPSNSGG